MQPLDVLGADCSWCGAGWGCQGTQAARPREVGRLFAMGARRALQVESVLSVVETALRAAAEDCRKAAAKYRSEQQRREQLQSRVEEQERHHADALDTLQREERLEAFQRRADTKLRHAREIEMTSRKHSVSAARDAAAAGVESVYAMIGGCDPAPVRRAGSEVRPGVTGGVRRPPGGGFRHEERPRAVAAGARARPPSPGARPQHKVGAQRRSSSQGTVPTGCGRQGKAVKGGADPPAAEVQPEPRVQPRIDARPGPGRRVPAARAAEKTESNGVVIAKEALEAATRKLSELKAEVASLEHSGAATRLRWLQQELRRRGTRRSSSRHDSSSTDAFTEWERFASALHRTKCARAVSPGELLCNAAVEYRRGLWEALNGAAGVLTRSGLLAGSEEPESVRLEDLFGLSHTAQRLLLQHSRSTAASDLKRSEACVGTFRGKSVDQHHARLLRLLPAQAHSGRQPPPTTSRARLREAPGQWRSLLREASRSEAAAVHVARCVVAEPLLAAAGCPEDSAGQGAPGDKERLLLLRTLASVLLKGARQLPP
eukprot:Hpha_TRINITY_DN6017_c0_g1::TRINITY_DN6017_c0_g1_i1::g.63496::m.63496